MRHLYAMKEDESINLAKSFERRRCNHHTLDEPLSTLECLKSIVDPKENMTNKHRYVIASQDDETRAHMRKIPGVPLVHIHRSVMLMEPISDVTVQYIYQEEKLKLRAGLKSKRLVLGKRVRDGDDDQKTDAVGDGAESGEGKKKRKKGPKGPNPLSMKKPKSRKVPDKHIPIAVKKVLERYEPKTEEPPEQAYIHPDRARFHEAG